MQMTDTIISCGIREIAGLDDGAPRDLIFNLLDQEWDESGGWFFSQVIFSDHLTESLGPIKTPNYGGRLAKYIKDNGLGSIVESKAIKNRNTGNKIKTWVWNVSNISKVIKTVGWKKPKREENGWW